MTREEMDEYARKVVDVAPPLTPAQRIRLAVLLRPDMPIGIRRPNTDAKPAASDAA